VRAALGSWLTRLDSSSFSSTYPASSRASSCRWGSSSRSPRSSACDPYRPSSDPRCANQGRARPSTQTSGCKAARDARELRSSGSPPAPEPATSDLLLLASRDSGAGMGHPSRDRSRRIRRIQEARSRRGTRSRDRDTSARMERGSGGKPWRPNSEKRSSIAHGHEGKEGRLVGGGRSALDASPASTRPPQPEMWPMRSRWLQSTERVHNESHVCRQHDGARANGRRSRARCGRGLMSPRPP
jgi:hypothetical protein